MDLAGFIQKIFAPLNSMMERAGMSEMDIYKRTPEITHGIQLATYALTDEMGAAPSENGRKFGTLIMSKTTEGDTEVGFFDILTDSNGGVGKALLHLLGFDHEQLTYRFQGRDFRLTDVHGKVVKEILA